MVVTNFGVHICNKGDKPIFIPYNKLKKVHFYEGFLGNDLNLNGIEINAPKLSKDDLHNLYSLIADVADGIDSLKLNRNITDAKRNSTKKTTPKTFVEQLRIKYNLSSNICYYDFDEKPDKKIQKNFQTALNTCVKPKPSEVPLVLFDSTVLGSAKDGFVLTNRGIHINTYAQKMEFITYGNLSVSQDNKDLITNSKPISMIPLSNEQVSKVVDVVKRCKLYSLREHSFENLITDSKPTETSKQTSLSPNSNSVIDLKTFMSGIKRSYIFDSYIYYHEFDGTKNEKVQKTFNAALNSYAKLASDESPLVCCDATLFGSAKDGFILTNKGIHIHSISQDTKFISYANLSLSKKENHVMVNVPIALPGNIHAELALEIDTGLTNEAHNPKVFLLIKDFKKYFNSAPEET